MRVKPDMKNRTALPSMPSGFGRAFFMNGSSRLDAGSAFFR